MIRARSTSRTGAVARLTRAISTERSASGSTVGSDIPMSTDGAAPTAVLQAYRELQTPSTSDPGLPAPPCGGRGPCRSALPRGLPQPDDVALGILQVGGVPHVADRRPRHDRVATQPGDLVEHGVDALDVDHDGQPRRALLAPEHPAVDEAGLDRSAVTARPGGDQRVLHAGHLLHLPAEGLLVEVPGSAGALVRDLEVHDTTAHHGTSGGRPDRRGGGYSCAGGPTMPRRAPSCPCSVSCPWSPSWLAVPRPASRFRVLAGCPPSVR